MTLLVGASIALGLNVYQLRQNMINLSTIAKHVCEVLVVRSDMLCKSFFFKKLFLLTLPNQKISSNDFGHTCSRGLD